MKFTKMLMCASLLFAGLIIIWCISKDTKTIIEGHGGGRGGGGHGGGHSLRGYGRGLGAAGLGYGLGRYYGSYGRYGGGNGGSYGYFNNYYPYPGYLYDNDSYYPEYPYLLLFNDLNEQLKKFYIS